MSLVSWPPSGTHVASGGSDRTSPAGQGQTDLSDLTKEICKRLGLDPGYVYRLDLTPLQATVYCYAGEDGFCKGRKYVVKDGPPPYQGQFALEPPATYQIKS